MSSTKKFHCHGFCVKNIEIIEYAINFKMRVLFSCLLSPFILIVALGADETKPESQTQTKDSQNLTEQQSNERAAVEAARLRENPPLSYRFTQASLREVLSFVANDAGINFISSPLTEDDVVTFAITASPFRVLEVLAEDNHLKLRFNGEENFWYIEPVKPPKTDELRETNTHRQQPRVWLLSGKEITPDSWIYPLKSDD